MNAIATKSAVFGNETSSTSSPEGQIFVLSTSDAHVRVPQLNSKWIKKLEDRFNELTALPLGWDGYEGKPVSFGCAQFAANLLERLFVENVEPPYLVPGGDGTLQLEWHMYGYDVEVDILAPYELVATRFNHITEEEEEENIQSDFTTIAQWIRDLAANRDVQLERGS